MDRHEMNQVELAEMLGLTQASVSLFLGGHTRPKDDTVRRISEGLGEDFDYLMGYKDTGAKGTGRIVGHILGKSTPEELELLRDIPDGDYHEMMGELALKYRKRKRKKPRTSFVCLGLILAIATTATLMGVFEHRMHRVQPVIFMDTVPGAATHICPAGAHLPHITHSDAHLRGAR
jgi:transcriptional regulator with XRE-family HTH domain